MIKFALLATLIMTVNYISGQNIIPDENFRKYLLEHNVDKNGDGDIQEEEVNEIKNIHFPTDSNSPDSLKIKSLEGIQYFEKLEILSCGYNRIDSLDLRSNLKLKSLKCNHNQMLILQLNGLHNLNNVDCFVNKINSLDLSNLTNLKSLNLRSNNLSNINLDNLDSLEFLSIWDNDFDTLSIDSLKSLNFLNINDNSLRFLSFKNCPNLKIINANNNSLNSILLDSVTQKNIEVLDFEENEFQEIDISHFDNLKTIYLYGNKDLSKVFFKAGSKPDIIAESQILLIEK